MHDEYLSDPSYKKAYLKWKKAYEKLEGLELKKKNQRQLCNELREKLDGLRQDIKSRKRLADKQSKEILEKDRLKAAEDFMRNKGMI